MEWMEKAISPSDLEFDLGKMTFIGVEDTIPVLTILISITKNMALTIFLKNHD
jgi:hypothetical protein